MASGEKEWQQIEEEITCSICGDIFTDPKTIPCLHTFCKRCIEGSIEFNKKMATVVCCPLCRAPLPPNEIESIPTNFTINRLIEIFGKRKESVQGSTLMKCGECVEEATAVTWCIECDNPLCHSCNEFHGKWKDFKSHTTVNVAKFLQNPKQALATPGEKAEFCKAHSNQPLDFYCKTCSMLICQYCMLKDHPRGHRDHDFNFVDEMVDEKREKMKLVIAPLKRLLEQVRNGVKKIEHCEKQVDIESEANIEKIRATYGEVYKLLKQQEEEAVKKVNTIKASFKRTLALQKENVNSVENLLAICDEFCENIVTINRTRQLLTYSKWIENRIGELTKQVEHTSLDPECKASNMIVTYIKPVEFANTLPTICGVNPNVPCCTVSSRVIKINSDPVKVTIALQDILGSPIVNQSEDLHIRCNKEKFLQSVHIEEESRGQYHIWYNPKGQEDHSLSVYWRGLALNHEGIKVLTSVRVYATIKQEVKVINTFGTMQQLHWPYQVAKGPNDEVIFRDNSTKQLVVFNKHFQYSHVIGGAGIGNGKFQCITGIAVDKKGYVYVADLTLHCIQKFNFNGEFISQLGSEGTANGEFQSPHGLMFQSDLLFVCDYNNHRIQVLQNEQCSYCFGQHGTEPGNFNRPADLTMNNSEDQLFITDCGNGRVQVFTLKGQFLKIFGNFTSIPFRLQEPAGIFYTPDGHLLISSNGTGCVLVFKEDGKFISAIQGTYQGKERFRHPCGVVMMDNGQIVIACGEGSNRLVVF